MNTATDTDPIKAAATLEADALQRAGQITLTQAKARVRDRQASPVAHLALQQRRRGRQRPGRRHRRRRGSVRGRRSGRDREGGRAAWAQHPGRLTQS